VAAIAPAREEGKKSHLDRVAVVSMDDAILDEESEEIESDVDRFLHGN
jgi:hypothetical protein